MSSISRRKTKNKILIILSLIFLIFSFSLLFYKFAYKKPIVKNIKISGEDVAITAKKNFSEFVKAKDGVKMYYKDADGYHGDITIHGNIELKLDPDYEIVDEYYKVLNKDMYISYSDVEKIDTLTSLKGEYKNYSNYVSFDFKVGLKEGAKLYVNDNDYYMVNGGEYPVIINDDDGNRYGIEFNNSLVYVSKDDVEKTYEVDSNNDYASSVSVLNYHYTVSSENENGEFDECQQSICITDTMFDKHISYLKDNNFYGASIRDLELFIDGKVRLPSKSVLITIDDGWYVTRSIQILEKYQMLGTLFLIGSLASPDDYRSDYLEIHSHTWDMHTLGQCPSYIGRGGILCLDEDKILEDLKKSRDSLNQTTYFCYPFYDYNDRAIKLLKEAGFTMAFAGGEKKVRVGQDKFKIPRYVIVNYTTMNEFINYVS